MINHKLVEEFHKTFGSPMNQDVRTSSTSLDLLRVDMLKEEVNELSDELALCDTVEVLDAIVDIIYLAIGTAVTYGLQDCLPAAFNEVHRSNMSKLDENGKPIYNDAGKVMKSNLYTPPNLAQFIEGKDENREPK
jgi:predicted HAD superfamily Cof-like phosphohydrolase